jgi:DNA processing protein
LTGDELKYWLALLTVPKIGPIRYIHLVKRFGSPEKVLSASERELSEQPDVGAILASNIRNKVSWKEAEEQLELLKRTQVRIVTFQDQDYPQNLLSIYDPPPFLFAKGEIKKEDENGSAGSWSKEA